MLRKYSSLDDFRRFYRENGYVVFTDLLSREELGRARSEIFGLFETSFKDLNQDRRCGSELMTFYYEKEKERWRRCAKRMYDLLGVYSLAAKSQVLEVLKQLGLETPIISTRPEVRTDMPRDDQYIQPWHQDWRSGQGSLNSVTIWAPLNDVSVQNGAIEIIPRSHLLGYLETIELSNPRRFSIVDPQVNNMPYLPVELEFGEVAAFSQMLVHRSGHNQTGSPRLTVQIRFLDYSDSLFLKNGLPSPLTSSQLLWKHPPSAKDMKQYFEI